MKKNSPCCLIDDTIVGYLKLHYWFHLHSLNWKVHGNFCFLTSSSLSYTSCFHYYLCLHLHYFSLQIGCSYTGTYSGSLLVLCWEFLASLKYSVWEPNHHLYFLLHLLKTWKIKKTFWLNACIGRCWLINIQVTTECMYRPDGPSACTAQIKQVWKADRTGHLTTGVVHLWQAISLGITDLIGILWCKWKICTVRWKLSTNSFPYKYLQIHKHLAPGISSDEW